MGCSNSKKSEEFEESYEETNTVVQEIKEYLTPDPPPILEPELKFSKLHIRQHKFQLAILLLPIAYNFRLILLLRLGTLPL